MIDKTFLKQLEMPCSYIGNKGKLKQEKVIILS